MCGIVGMIAKNSTGFMSSDLDTFQNLLVMDSVRGEDSTGVFGIYKNRQARTIKVAAEPHMLFRCNEWGDFRTKAVSSMNILVGHNRYATRGAVSTTNAHPFSEGKIVLVHNGTLHNHKDFNKDVEVDSHAITHAFNERPAKDVLSEIDGAFAFVWYNRSEGKLFVARNSERPLSFVETHSNIYFASEGGMLEYLLNRKSYANAPVIKAESFPVGKLISFDLKGTKAEEDFKLFTPKPYVTTTYGGRTVTTYHPKTTTTADSTDYLSKYTKVLLKLKSISHPANYLGPIKFTGTLMSHQPGIDVSGTLNRNLDMNDAQLLMDLPYVEGIITGSMSTTCGKTFFANDVCAPEFIKTYNTKIPKVLWTKICDDMTCDKCGGIINPIAPELTSVKVRNASGKFRIVCPDCVQEALDAATTPDTNKQDSNDQIPTGESLSQSTSDWPFPNGQQASTVH